MSRFKQCGVGGKYYSGVVWFCVIIVLVTVGIWMISPQYLTRSWSQIVGGTIGRIMNLFTRSDMTIHEVSQPHEMGGATIKYQDVFPGSNQSPLFAQETIKIENSDHQMHILPARPKTELILKNIFNDLSPLARFQLQVIPPKKLLELNHSLPPPHLTHDPGTTPRLSKIGLIEQLVIGKALDKSGGLNTNQFYKDLEKLAETNPWVFQHAKHYQQMDDPYMYLDPEIRAKELYAHLGALFGYNLLHTPLAPHYKGILKDPPSGDFNQHYLFATDPENVYKFNRGLGAYQSVNYRRPIIWPLMYPFNSSSEYVRQKVNSMTPNDAKKYNFKQPFHKLNLPLDEKMPTHLRRK